MTRSRALPQARRRTLYHSTHSASPAEPVVVARDGRSTDSFHDIYLLGVRPRASG